MKSNSAARRTDYFAALVAGKVRENGEQCRLFPLVVTLKVAVLARGIAERKKLFAALSGHAEATLQNEMCQLASKLSTMSGPEIHIHLCEVQLPDPLLSFPRANDFDVFLIIDSDASPSAGLTRFFPERKILVLRTASDQRFRFKETICAESSTALTEVAKWLSKRLAIGFETPRGKENPPVTEKPKAVSTRRCPFAVMKAGKNIGNES